MIIAVNTIPLREYGGGVKEVFLNTFQYLLEIDKVNSYIFFANDYNIPTIYRMIKNINLANTKTKVIEIPDEKDIFSYRNEYDLLFNPLNSLMPRLLDKPSVSYLADIQEHFFPQFFTKGDLTARKIIYPEIIRSSTKAITLSHFSKKTMLDIFKEKENKIKVIYPAVSKEIMDSSKGEFINDLPDNFIFYPSNLYPHKNHENLLKAIKYLKDKKISISLVLTGHTMNNGYNIEKAIKKFGLKDQVHYLGFVDYGVLSKLYKNASALVFPSLFEGFGIPLVEAMFFNCPVLCSNISSLNEVAGKSALYFNPYDPKDIADKIMKIRSKKIQKTLTKNGIKQVNNFTYLEAANRTLKTFSEAMDEFYKNDRKFVGICLIVYFDIRTAQNIKDTLLSVFKSGYKNYEIIVVGEVKYLSQEVKKIITETRIDLVNSDYNMEISFKKAALRVNKEWIMFLLSGQIVTEEALIIASSALNNKLPDDLLIGENYIVNNNNNSLIDTYSLTYEGVYLNKYRYINNILLPGMFLVNKKTVYKLIYRPYNKYKNWFKKIVFDYKSFDLVVIKNQLSLIKREWVREYSINLKDFSFFIDLFYGPILNKTHKTIRDILLLTYKRLQNYDYLKGFLVKLSYQYRKLPESVKKIFFK